MRTFRLRRPSPALVVSTIALIVAVGGTSYAAFKLPKNAVGTKQIKNGAVTGAKVANGTLTGAKIKLSTLGTVPAATNAANAATATSATNATNATTAAKLGQLFYRSAVLAVPTGARATGQAACGAGTLAVGGGVTSPDESTYGPDYLVDSHPTAGGAGWEVTVENESATSVNETVWVVCAPASSAG
jgi:hypothetical protein